MLSNGMVLIIGVWVYIYAGLFFRLLSPFLVARYVSPDATAAQCFRRYSRTLDPTLKRGTWSTEEDDRLRAAVAAYGKNWVEVATAIPGRTNEQCRDRWMDGLGSALNKKGQWSEEEDQSLLEAVKDLGNKWKLISARLGNGRSDANVSDYGRRRLKKWFCI